MEKTEEDLDEIDRLHHHCVGLTLSFATECESGVRD